MGDNFCGMITPNARNRWYPLALDMFGHSGSRRSQRYIEWGIKRRTNGVARIGGTSQAQRTSGPGLSRRRHHAATAGIQNR